MNHRGIRVAFWTGCACIVFCAPAVSQVVEPMGTYVPPRHRHMQDPETQTAQQPSAPVPAPAQTSASVPPAAIAATPPSLLDKPAEPAKIDLASGRLTIHADNSSLADILHSLTADSGMTVDGLGADQRIFGNYGPGDPQEVLSSLLDGSGYNVLMLGRTETGTPKQISLTPRVGGVANNGPMHQQAITQQDEDDEEVQQPQPQPASELPTPPNQPQQGTPPQNGVRTPQQMLQELQQMRQQQLQQQQQQTPPPPQQP